MNFYFGMGGTPISLRQKLRMQRERMQCAGLWPVVLNVLNSYNLFFQLSIFSIGMGCTFFLWKNRVAI